MVIVPARDLLLVYVTREIRERAYFLDLLDTGDEEDVTPLVVFMTCKGQCDESAFAGIDRERKRALEFGAGGFARAPQFHAGARAARYHAIGQLCAEVI